MAWNPFKKAGHGLRNWWENVTRGLSPKQPSQPSEPSAPQRRYQPVRDPLTTDEYPDDELRERAIERITEWRFEQFDSSRVRRNVNNADMLQVRLMLALDREGFRQMASVDPAFWYH